MGEVSDYCRCGHRRGHHDEQGCFYEYDHGAGIECDCARFRPEGLCPNCSGNGRGWPEHPTMCGGLPCPVCEGVCEVCLGSDDPTTWDMEAMR
jgi:hypothetical protein